MNRPGWRCVSPSQQTEETDSLTIRAEQSGVVTEVFVRAEGNAGTKLATLRNSTEMLLIVPFNEDDAANFTAGQAAATITVSGSFETLTGTVKEIDVAQTIGAGFQVSNHLYTKLGRAVYGTERRRGGKQWCEIYIQR